MCTAATGSQRPHRPPRAHGGCPAHPPARSARLDGLEPRRSPAASVDSHGIVVATFLLTGGDVFYRAGGGASGPPRRLGSSGTVLRNRLSNSSEKILGEKSSVGSRNSCRADLRILFPQSGTSKGKGLRARKTRHSWPLGRFPAIFGSM